MAFTLRDATLDLARTAPDSYSNEALVDVDPDAVFAILADITSWPNWFHGFRRGIWTSPMPWGLGSTRDVTVGALLVSEVMVAWEPGIRFAYAMTAINLPLVEAMLADWRLTERPGGKTLVRFDIHYRIRRELGPLHPLIRRAFESTPRNGIAGLPAFAAGLAPGRSRRDTSRQAITSGDGMATTHLHDSGAPKELRSRCDGSPGPASAPTK